MTTSTSTTTRPATLRADICIVGNGAVAKTAALGFAQAGHSVTLLAPSAPRPIAAPQSDHDWDARVYALSDASRKLLSGLRVWEAMDAARVARVESMQVNGDGKGAGALLFDAFGAHADALAWIVEDRNLNMALDAALRFAHNVRIVAGRAVRLASHADGAGVELESGEVLGAALVVGADGAQSWVRGQCDIGIDYRSYGQRAVVTNFSCDHPHHGVAHQWFTESDGIVALLPLPGQRVSLVWSAPDQLADTLMGETPAALAERVTQQSRHVLGALHALDPIHGVDAVKAFPLTLLRTHSLVAPHVALVGDAAHVVHPLAGQGMNLGFGDVAGLLAAVAAREPHRAAGDERVLARYARSRAEDILLMQIATDGLARLFGSSFEPLRAARNAGMHLLDKLPFLKRRLISHAMGR